MVEIETVDDSSKEVLYAKNSSVDGRPLRYGLSGAGDIGWASSLYKRTMAVVILGVIVFISAAGGAFFVTQMNDSTARSTIDVSGDANKIVTKEEEDIANVVSKVAPSVVSIVTQSEGYSFGGRISQQEGAGTGIIVGKDGYILTNKHVITGANAVSIILADGTEYKDVKILGSDPLNDVAFLKISNVSNLPAVTLGDSSSLRVGQKVIAIGNSLGQYQNTVTSGIVSGVGRPVQAQSGDITEDLTDLIQTDAAINPGNSGGPLLNAGGQVIGINTAVATDAQGIGFSIPINATKGMLKNVLAGGDVKRGYIGINYVAITSEVASRYELNVKRGAYIFSENASAVVNGSPADKAGIKDKDIITKVGAAEVGNPVGLASIMGLYAPGDVVEVTVLRGGKTLTVKVTVGTYVAP
jgi:serine protease Do